MQALTAFQQGDLATAIQLCQQHLEGHPDDVETWFLEAHCWLAQEELDNARDCLEQASQLAPERPEVWHDLGCCYLELGQPLRGLECLEHACQLVPGDERMRATRQRALRSVPVDLILVVDGSVSSAHAWARMQRVVAEHLEELTSGDRFILVVFTDDLQGYQTGTFRPLEERAAALAWMAAFTPQGGRFGLPILLERISTMSPEPERYMRPVLVSTLQLEANFEAIVVEST